MVIHGVNGLLLSWWRHQIEAFSALLALCAGQSPVIGKFPLQRPVTRRFDVFFDLRLNKRLCSLRHSNDEVHNSMIILLRYYTLHQMTRLRTELTLETPPDYVICLYLEQLWENPTCEGRLICPEEHVPSLNKCNPIQSRYIAIIHNTIIHTHSNNHNGKPSARLCIHERQPISCPHGRAMGSISWDLQKRKWPLYIEIAL